MTPSPNCSWHVADAGAGYPPSWTINPAYHPLFSTCCTGFNGSTELPYMYSSHNTAAPPTIAYRNAHYATPTMLYPHRSSHPIIMYIRAALKGPYE